MLNCLLAMIQMWVAEQTTVLMQSVLLPAEDRTEETRTSGRARQEELSIESMPRARTYRVTRTRLLPAIRITVVAPDKGAKDCAWLRHALLSDSLAGELGR